MFSADWKVRGTTTKTFVKLTSYQETLSNEVMLEKTDPEIVEAMVHFMYGLDYGSGGGLSCVSPAYFNAQAYSLAEKLGVPKLKEQAKEKFTKAINTCWKVDDLLSVMKEMYSDTPPTDRGLRDVRLCCRKNAFLAFLKNVQASRRTHNKPT